MHPLVLFFFFTACLASKYCPLLGPVFPAAKHLSDSESFAAAKIHLSNTLDKAIKTSSILNSNTTSLSLQLFSTNDVDPLLEYYYTAPIIQNATTGVTKVDADSVFRIGSVTKVLTILVLLVEEGDAIFHEPITKYIPELRNAGVADDEIDSVRWDEVTIGELASQLSGIGRDYGFIDLSRFLPESQQRALGLPALPENEIPPCGSLGICTRAQFFEGMTKEHPAFPTSSTPVYSNAAYEILAFALEDMKNQSFESLLQRDIINPLHLHGTTYSKPHDKYGVIPRDPTSSFWDTDLGNVSAAGSVYSTATDMAALGRAILKSTLLPKPMTRRWLKPASHTSSLDLAVGWPWEILSFNQSRTLDLYTKLGDVGDYSAVFALSPEYGFGFIAMVAGDDSSDVTRQVADVVSNAALPALEDAAREEACCRFSGEYATDQANSSISITADDGPGLKVEHWINNSTDMFDSLKTLAQPIQLSNVSIRLYPTGLETKNRVSFRAITVDPFAPPGLGPVTSSCWSWVLIDRNLYGSVGLDEFVFDVDDEGNAVAVTPRGLRVSLERV
ncbi:hypothetical protein MW887_003074 [Aspergillus wentii]|nr:hypothetical protein MW887_003074 [Aspergillus wentii]